MITTADARIKITFEVERDDGSIDLESLWARKVWDGYQIDSIPFYAVEIALDDVVEATADADGALRFSRLVRPSGHSTVRLWFQREADVQAVREMLRQLGCPSELDLSRLVAIDVPPETPYDIVRVYLDGQEAARILEYEEGCLGSVQT